MNVPFPYTSFRLGELYPEEIDMLEDGFVWTYQDGADIVYTIDFEYLEGSIKKVLVAADTDNTIKSINIMEIFIGSLNNTTSLHNVVLDSLVIYPVDSERSTRRSGGRNSIADCKKIVFGEDPGGTTGTFDPGGDGTTIVSNDGTNHPGIGGVFSIGGGNLMIVICGCKPQHAGGSDNPECECGKADRIIFVKKKNTLKNNDKESGTRNDQDYWDCIEDLIGCEMLNDYDLAIMTLEHCHAVNDVNDVDNHAGNDGSNQFIGLEFCDDWVNYQQDCLNGSTSMSDVYQPWAGFMIDYPDLFFNTIEALPECTSTEEMEEEICLEEAYNAFINKYNITPTSTEKEAIKSGTSCGENFESDALGVFIELDEEHIDEVDPDFNIDCVSFAFTPVGPDLHYQSCGVTGIDIDFVYTCPNPHGWGLLKANISQPIYFEVPYIRENPDGTTYVVTPLEASALCAEAVTVAEESMEIQYEFSCPTTHSTSLLLSSFITHLNTNLVPFGARATIHSNYGVVPIRPASYYSVGMGPCF